jgi:F-type H+-transporting ATPase subunit b
MLQIDSTLLLQIVNFLLLVWILNRLLFRPFLNVVEERVERTRGVRTQAEALAVKSEDLKEKYESGVSEATSQGGSYKEEQIRAGQSDSEKIVGEARIKNSDHIGSVRRELQASVDEARKELVQDSVKLAKEMTEKILGRSIG